MTESRGFALLGYGLRFPGAVDSRAFWRLLDEGRDAISEVPPDRWDVDAFYDPDPDAPGKMVARRAGFVDDVAGFDAPFFGVSAREAMYMDPQHRLLLETTWSAIEHAGIAPASLSGTDTGVFIGLSTHEFGGMLVRFCDIEDIDIYSGTGASPAAGAGRISYRLGLQGPSVVVDTACSSSLVAMHQACQALEAGDCDLAIVGGVNVILTPVPMINFSRARMLAPDGRCKTFDAAADGYVRGEGCGIVVLKHLGDAIDDGDPIRAVVRGSAVNQDGASGGLTVPNGIAQQRVIAKALQRAGIAPADIDYLEAHGTGTSLGDPIEVQAAGAAFGEGRDSDRPLLIGSVKTNIGHLEAASGVAGVIKVTMALEHEMLPQHLHFNRPSPHIPWDRLAIRVVDEATAWKRNGRMRSAGVSSFGFSGTNAHVVLTEPPGRDDVITVAGASEPRTPRVLHLSARSEEALLASADRYRDWLDAHPDADLADVCATTGARRSHFEHRAALVVDSRSRSRRLLRALSEDRPAPGLIRGVSSDRPKTAWLFGGQGSQFAGMGRSLFDTEPVFAETITACADAIADVLPRTLTSVLFDTGPEAERTLRDTTFAQPAIFALELGLARLWESWGVTPDVVLGHSVGQYAAACVAGVFDVDAGIRLMAERGRLFGSLPAGGRMVAVFADAGEVDARAAEHPTLSVAAYNGANTVLSGPGADLEPVVASFTGTGTRCEWLETSHAFHSALLDPVLDEFESYATTLRYESPRVALVCNRTGELTGRHMSIDARYWRRHARQPVRFADGVGTLAALNCRLLVDLGPQPVLLAAAMRAWPDQGPAPAALASSRNDADAQRIFTEALAGAFTAGHTLDYSRRPGCRASVDLPTYPFHHHDYSFQSFTTPGQGDGPRPIGAKWSGNGIGVSPPKPTETAALPSAATDLRHDQLVEIIRDELGAALRTSSDEIDPDAPFVSLGLDSLIALDLYRRLHGRLGIEVPASMLFAHPTVAALAGGLVTALSAQPGGADPIPRGQWDGDVPLAHAQEQLWFLNQLLPSSSAYNVAARLDIDGPVNRDALQRSLAALIARHDALRTTFHGDGGVPRATLGPVQAFPLPFDELPDEDAAAAAARREAAVPFDIAVGPLLRARLFALPDKHVLVLTMHHIVTDGWSFGVLLRELALTYRAFTEGATQPPLPDLPIQFPDYAAWQRQQLSGTRFDEHIAFWKADLAGAVPLELDTDRPRPRIPTFRGERLRFDLGVDRAAALRDLCRSTSVTVSVPLMAALAAVLQRYTSQDDVVIGTLTANRSRRETESLIGFFVNSLPVRLRLHGDPDVNALLEHVRQRMVDVLAHQDVPFDQIVNAIAPEREANRNPLFAVQLVVQPAIGGADLAGLGVTIGEIDTHTAKRDLTLTFLDDDVFGGHIEYASELFDAERIDRMVSHFLAVLDAMIADPTRVVSALPMLAQGEQVCSTAARTNHAVAESIPDLIATAADRTPDAVAVVAEDGALTYRELVDAADRLAIRLQARGVAPGTSVGLRTQRTTAMPVGMLGILKAGAIFVPVDPTHSDDRVQAMLADTGAAMLLTDADVCGLDVDPGSFTRPHIGRNDPAYVMFTSGSTGRPKGAAVSHGSVTEYVDTLGRQLGITADDTYLVAASASFSSSIRQLLVPLAAGATAVIATAEERRDPAAILHRIGESQVTVADLVPAVVRGIVDTARAAGTGVIPHRLRLLLTASEPLRLGVVRAWRDLMGGGVEWVNMYGQTETTGIVSLHPIGDIAGADQDIVPIGRARDNVTLHVLDRHRRPAPQGVSGELFIAGNALAREYVADPDLTAAKFISAPWDAGERLYATGDVVRLRADGVIEFRNRTDRQVKIRGMRVEPSEVDRVLLSHPAVDEAVTVVRDAGDDTTLVAYFAGAGQVSVGDLRAWARRELPDHMVPTAFVAMDRLPLTANGKVDRAALPDVVVARDEDVAFVTPRAGVEASLAEIWRATLGVDRIGAGDNFFALGGHSLLAAQVRSKIHQATGVELPLDALFDDQTLADLARRIEETCGDDTEAPPLARATATTVALTSYPASFAQEQMWLAERAEPGSPGNWIDVSIRIDGRLDPSAVVAGVRATTARHALLRTVFRETPAGVSPVSQVVLDDHVTDVLIHEGAPDGDNGAEWRVVEGTPPLRVDVFRLREDQHVLRLRAHRILGDGYSTRLLLSEIAGITSASLGYDDYTPLDDNLQYADYAAWERSWLSGPALERRIDHFRREFDNVHLPPPLPTDHPRGERTVRYGRQVEFEFPRPVTAAARALAVAEQASLYSVLLAAFASAVGRWTGQRVVALAAPVARRNERRTQLMLGPFMNTVPLLVDLDAATDLPSLVRHTKAGVLGALANQDAPWLHVLPALTSIHGPAAQRIAELGFLMDDPVPGEFRAGRFTLTRVRQERVVVRRPLTASMSTTRGQITGMVTYDDETFDRSTIDRLITDFTAALTMSQTEPALVGNE